jgi:hypothetical protein
VLKRVCGAIRLHFGVTLLRTTIERLEEFIALSNEQLGFSGSPGTKTAKIFFVRSKI